MDGHVQAFARFDGCAESCKYDSQKPVVLRLGRQPAHLQPALPCIRCALRVFAPRPFAVTPTPMPRVERRILGIRTRSSTPPFSSVDDFRPNSPLARQHRRPCPRHRLTRSTASSRKKPHLVALPQHPYDTARVIYRICQYRCFIEWTAIDMPCPMTHCRYPPRAHHTA